MSHFNSSIKKVYRVVASDDDEVLLYHVTYANRLESIAKHGLTPNASRSIGAPGYDSHAKGRVFLTDFDGVSFWMSRAEDFANHSSDHPLTELYVPVVLQTFVYKEDLVVDKEGTRDASSNAWFITKKIPADEILLWDGKHWIDVADHDGLDYEQAFDVREPDEDEGDEPLEYFKNESPFMPKEP